MISLYREGSGILHRIGAGPKLMLLAVVTLVLSMVPLGSWGVGAVLAAVIALHAVAGLGVGAAVAGIWRLRWLVLVLAGFLLLFSSAETAWISTTRVVAILLLAGLVTMTTRMTDLLDVLYRALVPLRRWGVNADAVALALLLALTTVPVITGFADAVRDAHRARGVRPGVRAVVPLLVMSLRHADEVGEALAARGVA